MSALQRPVDQQTQHVGHRAKTISSVIGHLFKILRSRCQYKPHSDYIRDISMAIITQLRIQKLFLDRKAIQTVIIGCLRTGNIL